eukprot:2497433-Heterocapsa_arctica.AAC.2
MHSVDAMINVKRRHVYRAAINLPLTFVFEGVRLFDVRDAALALLLPVLVAIHGVQAAHAGRGRAEGGATPGGAPPPAAFAASWRPVQLGALPRQRLVVRLLL